MADVATSPTLHPLLSDRWSTRAFDIDHELAPTELAALLEAARWAPSANNSQPWRFAIGVRGTSTGDAIASALSPGNTMWATAASALIVAAAETTAADGTDRPWAVYDTGQAVAHLTVQAQHLGLSLHQMGGFDRDHLTRVLGLPEAVAPLVVIAVGRHDPTAALPEPYASRETTPRERLPLADLLLTTDDAHQAVAA